VSEWLHAHCVSGLTFLASDLASVASMLYASFSLEEDVAKTSKAEINSAILGSRKSSGYFSIHVFRNTMILQSVTLICCSVIVAHLMPVSCCFLAADSKSLPVTVKLSKAVLVYL
jgi:hypothetical protein